MKKAIHIFSTAELTPTNTFRTILLFGNNVSTYKFALCSVLMKQMPKSEVKFQDLRDDFIKELHKHYSACPQQWTAGNNSITKAFDEYAIDKDWDRLVATAEKKIYNNVFDAFHNVGGASISNKYRLFEHDKKCKKLFFTDQLCEVLDSIPLKVIIESENQSRWLIVEEAWRNKLSPNLIEYSDGNFISVNKYSERVNLRSAVNILLPYQHGDCFYCRKKVNVFAEKDEHDFPDVDHLLPFAFLSRFNIYPLTPNGIWNLVIACKECNRGPNGKFDRPPKKEYFYRLLSRNILFTEEHRHTLKNAILLSLSVSNSFEVEEKMKSIFNKFMLMECTWEPKLYY